MTKTVHMGADHAGFADKEEIKKTLTEEGFTIVDHGTDENESCDYPDFARAVGTAVAKSENDRGILVCGTGIGMSIAANKVPGVRAAVVHNEFTAKASSEHNFANVLCLGSRVLDTPLMLKLIHVWLETPYSSEERHKRRVEKINELDRA